MVIYSKFGTPHIFFSGEGGDCLKYGTSVWYLHKSDGWTLLSLAHTWFIADTLDLVCDQHLTRATSQRKNGDHSPFRSWDTGVWLYVVADIWLLTLPTCYLKWILRLICVGFDKKTAFNIYGVICLPRSRSVHPGHSTLLHKSSVEKVSMCKASDCSLTTSKSAKLHTKLAILIMTHH